MSTISAGESILSGLAHSSSVCLTCSFQDEDMVVVHLLREHRPDVPVLFLDTGYHFPEVYRYRDEMVTRYKLNLINLTPRQTVSEQEAQFGLLYRSQPDRCCKLRKVEPLFAALENYDVWFTGLRRAQSPSRATLQSILRFPLPSGKELLKVSPLVDWTDQDVWTFAREHDIPRLPLYDLGYTSIGCQPCTSLPTGDGNTRSGRWQGRKLECGIHIAQPH